MKHYTYKFRIYPTQEQENNLSQDFWSARFVYNYYLNKSIQDYQQDSTRKRNRFEYQKDIVNLKKEECKKWLKQTNSQVMQQSLLNLDIAYNRFFKWIGKFPNFKKKNSKNSISIPQHFEIEWNNLWIPKYKQAIEIKLHREIEWKKKSLTISKDTDWKYYVSVLVEKEITELPKTWKSVGCDLGVKDLMITSDGTKYKTLKRKNEEEVATLQMRQSKKVKLSRRYKQLKTKIAKLHKHDANRRSNDLHKISKELVTDYDLIGLENLNTRWMMANHCLAKAIGNQWRNMLVSMLEYKADRYGKQVARVSRWYPSSKQCNNCWNLKRDLKLSDRIYVCECWYIEDRDVNAAKNILKYTQLELKF